MRDYTELVVVLDRSGSMHTCRADHEGGLRSFVRDQRQLAGDVRLTLVRFDDTEPFELVYDGASLDEVVEEKLELIPRGNTPLLDAVGLTILHVKGRLAARSDKPDMVVFMIITDGEENASRKFTKEEVKRLITEQEAAGWKALYLGANVDEFVEAAKLGVAAASSLGYAPSAKGVQAMYSSLVSGTACARKLLHSGATLSQVYASYNFTDAQRTAAMGEAVIPQTLGQTPDDAETSTNVNNPTQ